MVTREPQGGSEHPSENPVLTAELRADRNVGASACDGRLEHAARP